jgi:hypothetical protein
MNVVPHQRQLVIDGVVNSHQIFADIRRLLERCYERITSVAGVWLGNGAGAHKENGIRIDQVCWNGVVWKRLPYYEPVTCIQ